MKTKTVLSTILLLMGTSAAYAAPTVEGQVMSWGNDGRHQAKSHGYGHGHGHGGKSRANGKIKGITVVGNVISLPENGWYQVRSADTNEQICAGESSCEVEPGTYIVIKHTKKGKKRFSYIEVEGSPAPQALITMDSHVDIVANILAIYSGKLYGEELIYAPRYSDPTFLEAWPVVDIATAELITQPSDIVCDNGGTLNVIPESEGKHVENRLTWNFDFNDCQDGVAVFDGKISRGIYESYYLDSDEGFAYDDQIKVVQFSGSLQSRTTSYDPPFRLNFWLSTGINFSQVSSSSSLIIEDATTVSSYYDGVSGGFSVQADWTDDQKISAQTLSDFDPNKDTGQLEIVAESGNSLLLDAETGDTETVNVTITANGVSETVTQPWTLWSDNLTFTTESGY